MNKSLILLSFIFLLPFVSASFGYDSTKLPEIIAPATTGVTNVNYTAFVNDTYVPYVGAIRNTNLNSKNLTTTGTGSFGNTWYGVIGSESYYAGYFQTPTTKSAFGYKNGTGKTWAGWFAGDIQLNGFLNVTDNITAERIKTNKWGSEFGNDTYQYWKVEELNLGATGSYPMLAGYSDGGIGNIGAIADNLIIYDKANSGQTRILFSADDLSNVALMQFEDAGSLLSFTKYAGSAPIILSVNGSIISTNSIAGANGTLYQLNVGQNSLLLPRSQDLMVYGSANITGDLLINGYNVTKDFIPYVGATQNIDLNIRNVTANGSMRFGYTPQSNFTLGVFPELGTATAKGRVGILNDNPQIPLQVCNAGFAGACYIGIDSASNRAGGYRWYNAGTQIWALFKNNDNLNTMGLANASNDIIYKITQDGTFTYGNQTAPSRFVINGNLNVSQNMNVLGNSTITITHSGMFTSSEIGVGGSTLGASYMAVNFTDSVHGGDGFYFNGTSLQLIDPQQSGEYQIQWHTQKDGTQNHIYFAKIFVNDIEQNNTMDRGVGQASNALRMMGMGFINVSYGDNITLRMKDISVGGSTPVVYIKNVNLWRIGRPH